MQINLKAFQEEAIDDLILAFFKLSKNSARRKICVLCSPTGSGKTVITAKFIERYILENPTQDLCFIWVSIGKGELHLQSKRTLSNILNGSPKVTLLETDFHGGRKIIDRNEVVVVNWEKIRSKDARTGEWKNTLMKDGERINFREVLVNTRAKRKVIMIIDESHIGATAERTNELRTEIDAEIILEISATPKIVPTPSEMVNGTGAWVEVQAARVIDEGLIKKEIIINLDLDKIAKSDSDSQTVVLEAAYKKRTELQKSFANEGLSINPLVLIQIPNADAGSAKLDAIKSFLADKNITELSEGNGKLAVWLDQYPDSDYLDTVSENNNPIEFLVFKQAIDTGWDCPRAHILVKFRESHSEIFEIQVVGRILRMPEQKHYLNDSLNTGYIYTNVQSIIVKKEEYNPNIIKHLKGLRGGSYTDVKLPSYFKTRADYGDITSSFVPVFSESAATFLGIKDSAILQDNFDIVKNKGLDLDIERHQQEILTNYSITSIGFDDTEGVIDGSSHVSLTIAGNDLQSLFENFLIERMGTFTNVNRSIADMKSAYYAFFRKYLGSRSWSEEIILIQKIVISPINISIFSTIMNNAISKYSVARRSEVLKRVKAGEQFYAFEVPLEQYFNGATDEIWVGGSKSIVQPCYLSQNRSDPERQFEVVLEREKEIIWWFKNGINKVEFMGIKYEYPLTKINTFYPDYIVKYSNGAIGIYEVKDDTDQQGGTVTKAKAESLAQYIKTNSKARKIVGGIAVLRHGNFLLNSESVYNWEKTITGDWSEWVAL